MSDDAGSEQYSRGVVGFLPRPNDTLSERELGELEEVQVSVEEPWSDIIEDKLHSWLVEAQKASLDHQKSAFKLKSRYRLFTFIILFWSAVILVVNDSVGCNANKDEKLIKLLVNATGVFLNALFTSLNLGYTYRIHFEYETKYFELGEDIAFMLMRHRDFRQAADSFTTEIRERRKKLALAPEFAGNRFFGC